MIAGPFTDSNFRKLFAGRALTNLGDSLYFVAAMWLVYELTGDPFYTGLAGFLTMIPSTFQFLAGPLVDRWPLRRTLFSSQALQAVLVLGIPVAEYYGVLTVELVLVVMPLLSIINEIANPAMVATLPKLIEDSELVAANSAIAVAKKGVDLVGNGIAGILIGLVGATTLFAFNSATFVIAALLFAMLVIPEPSDSDADSPTTPEDEVPTTDGGSASDEQGDVTTADCGADGEELSYIEELRMGFSYIRGTVLTKLMVGAAVLNFTSGITLAAMPSFADSLSLPAALTVFGAAGAYGILMGAFSAGTFIGSIATNLVSQRPLGYTLMGGFGLASACWIVAIAVSWLPVTATLFVVAFIPMGVINIQLASLIQSAPPENIVGRVTSLYSSLSAGAIPFGSLVGGVVTNLLGVQTAMFVVGVGLVCMTAYIAILPELRTLPRVEKTTL
ncbi:MFS transporter [Natrinema salsiterrestre]|uniref:MFS transporter n=1 Tax=Natrinema salsiterrestre TaxID=2950540 RepID=A0A9Q4KZ10_9EURY|nr:MFS transporter [Natrinema salsiterrestre]MDF9744079.1 MFS transporter [Natrinema salsiterrestre]